MKKNRILFVIVPLACIVLMLSFREPEQNDRRVPIFAIDSISLSPVQSGDIIFRDGRGFMSSAFRKLSLTEPAYSHTGIIHRIDKKLYVYHLIGGENNPDGLMRLERIENFLNPENALAFAVYRSDLDNSEIDSLAGVFYNAKIKFDMDFDLATDDRMYCTEMVYKILCSVSRMDNYLPLSKISGHSYIACDNIYLSRHMTNIITSKKQ